MLRRSNIRIPETKAPLMARWFCPAGPPSLEVVEHDRARVVAVPGRYCVNYLIEGADSLVLVDPGSAADLNRLAPVITWLGKPVSLVVPSHLHFDHVLGVDVACAALGAELAVSQTAIDTWRQGRALRLPTRGALRIFPPTWLWQGLPVFAREDLPWVRRLFKPLRGNPFDAQPTVVLSEGDALPGCPGWTVLSTPGHADEAVCLFHQKAGFLVAGDTVRNFQGGEFNPLLTDRDEYRATVERLKRLPVNAVFPGHGPVVVGVGVLNRLRPV